MVAGTVINCECGLKLRGETEDEVLAGAERHCATQIECWLREVKSLATDGSKGRR
jgi:hypothetical protein